MTITAVTVCVYAVFIGLLIAAAVIDLRTLRIPDFIVGALFLVWAAWRVAVHFLGVPTADNPIFLLSVTLSPVPLTEFVPEPVEAVGPPVLSFAEGIMAAIMLGGGLLVITAVYEKFTHKRAMGGGDIKLLAAVGLYLGIEGGIFCLLVSCAVSLVLALVLPRLGWQRPKTVEELTAFDDVDGDGIPDPATPVLLKDVPFGPAIALGAFVTVIFALL